MLQSLLFKNSLQKFPLDKEYNVKIAFVANTSWNIYNFRKGLVRHFLSKGDEVIILAPYDEYTEAVESWGCKFFPTPLENTGTNPIKDFKYLNTIRKVFRKEKPEVALSFTIKSNIYTSISGKLTSVPVICNVSGLGTVFLVKGLVGKLAISLYRIAFRFSSAIFFQNQDDQELFTSFVQIAKDRLHLVPGSGIDLTAFKPTSLPLRKEIKFLMISRIIIEKGVREYAHAASHFADQKNVSFTIVGKYDQDHARSIPESEWEDWKSMNHMTILPHSNSIKELIENHDVIVLPSYREGTPRTLLEGAAMGRPIITTNTPGCKEVVRDGFNGFLCEVGNAKNLSEKIQLFLSLSDQEKQHLGTNSRLLVEEKFREEIVIDTYVDVIRRINETP